MKDKFQYTAVFTDGTHITADSEEKLNQKIQALKQKKDIAMTYHHEEEKDWCTEKQDDVIIIDKKNASNATLEDILHKSQLPLDDKRSISRKIQRS